MRPTKPSNEELELENRLFGDPGFSILKSIDEDPADQYAIGNDDEKNLGLEALPDGELFYFDDSKPNEEISSDTDSQTSVESNDSCVWHDSDDESVEIDLEQANILRKLRKNDNEKLIDGTSYVRRLRTQFQKIHARPSWIAKHTSEGNQIDAEEMEEEEEEGYNIQSNENSLKCLFRNYPHTLKAKSKRIEPYHLDVLPLPIANMQSKGDCAVQTMQFHPNRPILAVGGYDRSLRIFFIDGKSNTLIKSAYFKNLRIQHCEFISSEHNSVLVGGRRRYMYLWDLTNDTVSKISRMYGYEDYQHSFEQFSVSADGQYAALVGYNNTVNIISVSSGHWITSIKADDPVADVAWDQSTQVIAITTRGKMFHYNFEEKKICKVWTVTGAVSCTKLVVSSKWIAIGSQSGHVYVYSRRFESYDQPTRVFDNLVTSISDLKIHPSQELLLMTSRAVKNAARLVHLDTMSVYKNWPSQKFQLGRITSSSFSADGCLLSLGDIQGRANLFYIKHYAR